VDSPPTPPPAAADKAREALIALGRRVRRHLQAEWFGSPFHLLTLGGPKVQGVAAAPHDPRPKKAGRGQPILSGVYHFAGQTLDLGPGGDPWDRPSPTRAFSEALHRLDWLGDLLATGEAGEREALRLVLDWRRIFGGWNSFSWSPPILQRRTINLACALRSVTGRASDIEAAQLCQSLARQGRQLLQIEDGPIGVAERAAAAAIAGATLSGEAGERLMTKGLDVLDRTLPHTVLADGGHASRSPQAGLELLLDLLTLDDALSQRGRAVPAEMARAIDRLSAALRLLVLPDGRLATFQGGEEGNPEHAAAARAALDVADGPSPQSLPQTGYHRLSGRALTVIADAGKPAAGAWSEGATAQPLAIEVLVGADRLITNCGWSAASGAPDTLRLTNAASTLTLGDGSAGELAPSRLLHSPLRGGPRTVEVKRHETPEGGWLELSHDGWAADWGLVHHRMIYIDRASDELRGEDSLSPVRPGAGQMRVAPLAIRFHLHPQVRASLARDGRSVLIQGPTAKGWWLRNDAAEVSIEPSVHYEDGQPRRTSQIVLRGQVAADAGGRVRWKLAAVEPAQP